MTKQEEVNNYRKMYTWIAEKSLERKQHISKADYFIEHSIENKPYQYCYLCDYAIQYGKEYNYCAFCPIKFDSGVCMRDRDYISFATCPLDDYTSYSEFAYRLARKPELPLSKEIDDILYCHKRMWNWLSSNMEKDNCIYHKHDYFDNFDIEIPFNECYMCYQCIGEFCKDCILDWGNDFCYTETGLYTKFEEACALNNVNIAVKLAREIANLPLK